MDAPSFVLIHIHLRKPLAEAADYFIVDGAGFAGDIVRCDLVDAVFAHDGHFVTETHIWYVGHIDHAHIHTDRTGDRCINSVDDDLALCRIRSRKTIGIAYRDGSDQAVSLSRELASVADTVACRDLFQMNDIGLDGHCRAQSQL